MKSYTFIGLFFFSYALSFGQISLNFPMERQIFQRNNSNQSYIHISGNFTAEYDSITAKVFPRVVGQGVESQWQTVDYRDDKPYFSGKILATGGWYKLGVKAYKNGVQIDSVGKQRVGIGEVFVIAGQSNATGTTSTSGVGIDSNEDRSVVTQYANKYNDYNALPIGFSPMNADSVANDSVYVGPFQNAPWCWGKLSQDLVTNLNVPVLIYGAGFGGTSVRWWKESANGEPLTNPSFFVQQQYNHPYGALASVMRMYASLTGIRAVLWHQGESDHALTANEYQNYLEQVIAKSREQVETSTLAWMVARASYAVGAAGNVYAGQEQTISNDVNVFAGPDTDLFISNDHRSDGIHLDKPLGLMDHANGWLNFITNGFLSNSQPILAQDFIELNFACDPGSPSTPISLNTAGSYSKYAWSNRNNTDNEAGGYVSDWNSNYSVLPPAGYQKLNWKYDSTSSITVGSGKYALNVRKVTSGKMLFSPVVNLTTFTLPTMPDFALSESQIRSGDTLVLTGTNCNGLYQWSTLEIGNPLEVYPTVTESYTVACKTLHCLSNSSAPKQIVVSSCFSTPLSLTGGVYVAENPYQSQQEIQSIQKVHPSGKINYSANNYVLLNPGFTANSGSVFQATIQNCP